MVMHWIYLHNSLINIFVLLARVTYLPNNSFHYLIVRLPYIKSYDDDNPDTSSKSFAKFIEYKDFVIRDSVLNNENVSENAPSTG